MRLFAKSFITTFCIAFLLWLLVSWADVLMHQFAGAPALWNLFRILTEVAK